MLTLAEIDDGYEVQFRHQAEDLPDHMLHALLADPELLASRTPPSLTAALARDIIAGVLAQRGAPARGRAIKGTPEALPGLTPRRASSHWQLVGMAASALATAFTRLR